MKVCCRDWVLGGKHGNSRVAIGVDIDERKATKSLSRRVCCRVVIYGAKNPDSPEEIDFTGVIATSTTFIDLPVEDVFGGMSKMPPKARDLAQLIIRFDIYELLDVIHKNLKFPPLIRPLEDWPNS